MSTKTKSVLIPLKPEDECEFSTVEILPAVEKNGLFRLKGFPFFASAIAPGDQITVKEDEDFLLLDEVVVPSGNSVIQVQSTHAEMLEEVYNDVKEMGCEADFFNEEHKMLCIIIPASQSYAAVQKYLIEGFDSNWFDFREACVSEHHLTNESNILTLE